MRRALFTVVCFRPPIEPAWLKLDGQVLRFFAYFRQPVEERAEETFRIRNCVIYYYLEDGTIQVNEPKVESSGIPQGALLKRHLIPNVEGNGYLGLDKLKLGGNIEIYTRMYKIVDCDEFTSWFCDEIGHDLGEPIEPPTDTFFEKEMRKRDQQNRCQPTPTGVQQSKEYMEIMLGGSRKNVGLKQHLCNDRKVLRFQCYWDDTARYGTRIYYVLHYFLADDTAEILESYMRNSGRDPFPAFLRRQKLQKNPCTKACPGMAVQTPEYYRPEDLIVGQEISIYSRTFRLFDCDDFTRKFYREYIQLEQKKEVIKEEQLTIPVLPYPVYTGVGSEEDSLSSCISLVPKPPRVDQQRRLQKDKMLRFEAIMTSGVPEDDGRRFVVGIRESDEGIGVWEVRQKNRGHTEGTFAELGRKKSPSGAWYTLKDFYVGATLLISSVPFKLVKADECTLRAFSVY
eukprot:GHVQ01023261.1.p1 GENE.GHVQ01023261.1~~GHVQ01023261.1.p1  ORF type:complete len:456 (+),score=30.04 GHVQ01023261.1:632-1999(+)